MAENATSIESLHAQPEQEPTLRDLTLFFGPDSEKFIKFYRKKLASSNPLRLTASFNIPVFFFFFVWFFYRKMYLYGFIAFILPFLYRITSVALGFDNSMLVVIVLMAFTANQFYLDHAMKYIRKADALNLSEADRTVYLQSKGGTSLLAGSLAFLVWFFMVYVFYTAIFGEAPFTLTLTY